MRREVRAGDRSIGALEWRVAGLLVAILAAAALVTHALRGKDESGPATAGVDASARPQHAAPIETNVGSRDDGPRISRRTQPPDDTSEEFVQRARAADLRRTLMEDETPADVLELLGEARIRDAAQLLEARARQGDAMSNVLLARLAANCANTRLADDSREAVELLEQPGDVRDRMKRSPADLRERAARLERAERDFRATWQSGCAQERFDTVAIEQRLRTAADAGHGASLWQLGLQSTDLTSRRKYWISAAMLDHVRAQIELSKLMRAESAAGGGDRSREGADFWLSVAANRSPEAKTSLAFCRLNGCSGQAPDPDSALVLIREAAQQGYRPALQSLLNARSNGLQMPAEERFAWVAFERRLLEEGCFGSARYALAVLDSDAALEQAGERMSPFALQQARALAEKLWRDHAAQARAAQQCGVRG